MTADPIIHMSSVDRIYTVASKPFYALKNIDLSVVEGEFMGLVGPSGSGKTSLLNLMGALDLPSNGHVNILGHDTKTLTNRQAAHIRSTELGFVFQHYQLLPVYTVYENVEFPLILLKINPKERYKAVMEALEWVGLDDRKDSRPDQLSGGQCQRVAIARAMVKKPKVVLADEPTANLDAENSHIILKMMVQLNELFGTTFIFSTHDEKVISYLRRKLTMEDGSIIIDEQK